MLFSPFSKCGSGDHFSRFRLVWAPKASGSSSFLPNSVKNVFRGQKISLKKDESMMMMVLWSDWLWGNTENISEGLLFSLQIKQVAENIFHAKPRWETWINETRCLSEIRCASLVAQNIPSRSIAGNESLPAGARERNRLFRFTLLTWLIHASQSPNINYLSDAGSSFKPHFIKFRISRFRHRCTNLLGNNRNIRNQLNLSQRLNIRKATKFQQFD